MHGLGFFFAELEVGRVQRGLVLEVGRVQREPGLDVGCVHRGLV